MKINRRVFSKKAKRKLRAAIGKNPYHPTLYRQMGGLIENRFCQTFHEKLLNLSINYFS